LSQETANQIAAGEVVERPASIVKEMVENAIDAGATDIRVELEGGGCRSITVTDNGSGIERDDVALVFERHATSKISRMEDIYTTGSFGFRGEAMPSIASVAKVEMLTRRADDLEGTKAVVQAGFIEGITPVGTPAGTQIRVTDIFANVPARRKFLKTEATEQGACLDAVTRIALARPEVRFTVTADGRRCLQRLSPKISSSASAWLWAAISVITVLPFTAGRETPHSGGLYQRRLSPGPIPWEFICL
jgi:DNA mismatch repair protein MutL